MLASTARELVVLDSDNQTIFRLANGTALVLAKAEQFRPDSFRTDTRFVRTKLTALATRPNGEIYFVASSTFRSKGNRLFDLETKSVVYRLGSVNPLFEVTQEIGSLAVAADGAVFFSSGSNRGIGKFEHNKITYYFGFWCK